MMWLVVSTVYCLLSTIPSGGLPATDTIMLSVEIYLESYNATTNISTYQQLEYVDLEVLAYNNETTEFYYAKNITLTRGNHTGNLASLFTIPANFTATDLFLFGSTRHFDTSTKEVALALTDTRHYYTANFTFRVVDGEITQPQPGPGTPVNDELLDSFIKLVSVVVFILIVLLIIMGFKKILSPLIEEFEE